MSKMCSVTEHGLLVSALRPVCASMKDGLKMDTKPLMLRLNVPSLFSMLPETERKHKTKQMKMLGFGVTFIF